MNRTIVRLAAGMLALTPTLADAATACFTRAEQDAALLRQLRSEMMVIALTCRNYTDLDSLGYYDRFVTKHRQPLQNSAKVLQAHFKRYYGGDSALTRLEKYDTLLANNASNRNMDIDRDGFCARSKQLLADSVDVDTGNLVTFSLARVSPADDMPLCGGAKPATRTAAVAAPPLRPAAVVAPKAAVVAPVAPSPAPPPPPPSLITSNGSVPNNPSAPSSGSRPPATARPR